VKDGFFLKRELEFTAYVGAIYIPVWAVLVFAVRTSSVASAWLVIGELAFVTAVGLYPILKTYQMEQRRSSSQCVLLISRIFSSCCACYWRFRYRKVNCHTIQ